MSEDKKDDLDILEGKDENVHFDMYHFFSRKDVIAIIVLVLLLLGYTAYTTFVAPQPL